MVFGRDDLIPLNDAAELIDSAQGCARLMAECCAAKDAEIARLREAIRRWCAADKAWTLWGCTQEEMDQATYALHMIADEIAREGR